MLRVTAASCRRDYSHASHLAFTSCSFLGRLRFVWTVIALVPGMTTAVVPFLLVYGMSYFFTGFGPNMTTFVLPSELFEAA
jgi:hypothetical protein